MGEIGFNRREFLHDLKWWELVAIFRGHEKRKRHLWSSTRWQTYNLMQAFCGSDNLKKIGIYNPTDLIHFPWESDPEPAITEDEAATLKAELDAINAEIRANQEATQKKAASN